MTILVLGANGYIGSFLVRELSKKGFSILALSRKELDFDQESAQERLSGYINGYKPRMIINAVGAIDENASDNFLTLANAILKPTISLFSYYRNMSEGVKVDIVLLGSTAAGKPRVNYPIYAALKGAEVGLTASAQELFQGTGITWNLIEIPRLKGGLAGINSSQEEDVGLDNLLSEVLGILNKRLID